MPLRQDCPQPLINSTTGHYNSTCTHSTSLWLAFLANCNKEELGTRLRSAQLHQYALSCLPEIYQKYRCLYILDSEWQSILCLQLRRFYWKIFPCVLAIYMKHGIVDCFLNIFACVKLEQLYAIAFFIFSFLHETLLSHIYDFRDREVEMQQFDIHRYCFFNLSCVCRVNCDNMQCLWTVIVQYIPATSVGQLFYTLMLGV